MPEKKEIICVIGQLGNGGTERQLHYFLRMLDREKYSAAVVVTGSSEGVWHERIAELGIEIVSLEKSIPAMKFMRFAGIVRGRRPAVIFSWSFFTNMFCLTWGAPFVGSMRNSLAVYRKSLGTLRTKACLKPGAIVVNSSELARELASLGAAGSKARVIFNMFEAQKLPDAADRSAARKSCNIPENALVLAGVGRNSPTKDFPFFVESFARAAAQEPRLHGLLIGSGGTAMKEDIARRGLADRFTICGEVPDARTLLPAADIFFLSSREEGMPNVLLEGIAAGAAPLATEVPGVRDILGPDFPFISETLLSERDPAKASAKLIALASNPELRTKSSEAARANLSAFSPERIMPSYMEALGFRS